MKIAAALTVGVSLGLLGLLIGLGSKQKPKASVKTAPRQTPVPRARQLANRKWTQITTTKANITAGRAYAGVIQLEGIQTWGNASDVEDKLRELCSWERLQVSDKPIKAKFPVPWTTAPKDDRYWALGVASSSAPAAEVPEQVVQLFER